MDALALLQWYDEMGIDTPIEENAVNQLASSRKAKPAAEEQTSPAPVVASTPVASHISATTTNPMLAAAEARKLADNAKTLEDLRKAIESFEGCAIKKTATNTVFCDGNPEADVMLIGEAPGANEDIEGIPFCGASGQLLDQMLSCIDLSRKKNLYITNTIFWRPPGNRRPTLEEIAMCKPFVEKHIALVNPKLILLAGSTAISSILNSNIGITKMRSKFYEYSNQYLIEPIKVAVTFHPSYLLRSPGQKKYAWNDLLKIQEYIESQKIKV